MKQNIAKPRCLLTGNENKPNEINVVSLAACTAFPDD